MYIYLMIIYIIIWGPPISECFGTKLCEALFTKSTSVHRWRYDRIQGRLSFKQYLPAKPTKYGIKFFAICDSVTGYCMQFEIYYGRDEILSCGFTFNTVNKLISPYIEYNHILCTDNFYTSIKLARYLRGFRTHLVGTVRKNSKLFPKFWNQTVQPDENINLVDSLGIVACR